MADSSPKRPTYRQEFKIAIICALTLEADMIEMILDKDWADEGIKYGKAPGDLNTYTTGVILDQNVVLAYCSTTGSNNAAQVATGLRSSFTGIRLAFVVGLCGASPFTTDGEEILLGDCLIGTAVIQFDLGRFGPQGFAMKDGFEGLGKTGIETGALLAKLKGRKTRIRLKKHLISYLQALHEEDPEIAQYPGKIADQLFASSCKHDHGQDVEFCEDCDTITGICGRTCAELRCGEENLISRKRLENNDSPSIHFGCFASSNSVIKDAEYRDALAKAHKVIAFEMEGSGVWDMFPTIVVKAACDYADSHKNHIWQPYAAAVAASGLKALLQELDFPDEESLSKENTTISSDAKTHQNVNHLNNSTVHGVVANNVYGGVHYYKDKALTSTATPQGSELDAISRADTAIRTYYTSGNRLEIIRLSGEVLSLDRCYINLTLARRFGIELERNEELPFSLRTRNWFETINDGEEITLQGLFTRRRLFNGNLAEPRRLFIQGRAGVGKTTLCKKIVHEFLHQRLGNKLFDRLLWIPLRKLRSRTENYGWQQLIYDAFSPQVANWDELVKLMSRKLLDFDYRGRTLFLFDGLDEISHTWKRGDSMHEFLADIFCDLPNIIITSRPQANSFSIGNFDLELNTHGFTPGQVQIYIERCVKNEELVLDMKNLIKQKPILQGLFRIPIQLDAFCYSWPQRISSRRNFGVGNQPNIHQQDDLSTMTTLYQAITEELCVKDADRLEKAPQPQRLHPTRIRELLQKELDLLAEFAFQGLVNGIAIFTPEQQDMIEAHMFYEDEPVMRDSFILERLSFLRTSDVDQDPSKRNYHFLHLTFQEFFAAQYFVKHWRTKTDLIRLDLVSGKDIPEGRISPTEFLQSEKYNPQFNIFWRFVTGLTQTRLYEQRSIKEIDNSDGQRDTQDVITFFAQLNGQPLDLLGAAHRQLIMFCSSEILAGYRKETQAFYEKQRTSVKSGLVLEFKKTASIDIASNSEFPESILCDCLVDGDEGFKRAVLSKLIDRHLVTTRTLDTAADLLDSKSKLETQLAMLRLICGKSEMASPNTLARIAQVVKTMLTNQNQDVCISVLQQLGYCTNLPMQIVKNVISTLVDGAIGVRKAAVNVLFKQSTPSPETVEALVLVIQDQDLGSLIEILKALPHRKSLPEAVIINLLLLLKSETEEICHCAASLLSQVSDLSLEVSTSLMTMFENENTNTRKHVATVLKGQTSLPRESSVLLIAKIKDQNPDLQGFAADILSTQSNLPIKDLASLIAMLMDDDMYTQELAARALQGHSSLPTKAVIALIAMLGGEINFTSQSRSEAAIATLQQQANLSTEMIASIVAKVETGNPYTQASALKALKKRSSLSRKAIDSVITALEHEDLQVRMAAAACLAGQSLSEGDIDSLAVGIRDKSNEVKSFVMTAISHISPLPEQAIDILIGMLSSWNDPLQRSVAFELGCHPHLPPRAINALLGEMQGRSYGLRFIAAGALQRQSSLPIPALNALIMALSQRKHDCDQIHQDIFKRIDDISDYILLRLWEFLLTNGSKHDLCCYEYKNCLYMWSDGRLYRIANGPARTKQLLQLMLDVKIGFKMV